jgi:hypothetical protein
MLQNVNGFRAKQLTLESSGGGGGMGSGNCKRGTSHSNAAKNNNSYVDGWLSLKKHEIQLNENRLEEGGLQRRQ